MFQVLGQDGQLFRYVSKRSRAKGTAAPMKRTIGNFNYFLVQPQHCMWCLTNAIVYWAIPTLCLKMPARLHFSVYIVLKLKICTLKLIIKARGAYNFFHLNGIGPLSGLALQMLSSVTRRFDDLIHIENKKCTIHIFFIAWCSIWLSHSKAFHTMQL